jgi:hypothetical protein
VDTDNSSDASRDATSSAFVAKATGSLYKTPFDALKAVREDYLYWTGKLTDTSVQLSYALIAANWAVFGSIDAILHNFWSRLSLGLVVTGLVLNAVVAMWMGEMHRKVIDSAEKDAVHWKREFERTSGKRDPFPFTNVIEWLGLLSRWAKMSLPIGGGLAFLIALVL